MYPYSRLFQTVNASKKKNSLNVASKQQGRQKKMATEKNNDTQNEEKTAELTWTHKKGGFRKRNSHWCILKI